jgi:hypothetical protein
VYDLPSLVKKQLLIFVEISGKITDIICMQIMNAIANYAQETKVVQLSAWQWLVPLLSHDTPAQRVILLLATVNLFLDSQLDWILLFRVWPHPMARFRSLRSFLNPPTGITAASPLGPS